MTERQKAPPTVERSQRFRSVEVTITGTDTGHLGDVLGHCVTLAREGISGTVKAAGITGTVKVER